MKNFNFVVVHWKIRFLRWEGGGCMKKQYIGGELPKNGVMFLRGVETPMHTELEESSYWHSG